MASLLADRVPLPGLVRTVGSQAHTAWLNRTLWSPRHLLGAVRLPLHWALRRDYSAPHPLALAWYLTHACPEACDFCNVTQALDQEQPAMSPAQAGALVDRLVPRIPVVALGGGEPMVYPGVVDLIDRIQHRGGRVFLVTSGTPVGPGRAGDLARMGPAMIMVSILGDEASHDRRMGRAGTWRRATAAVRALVAARDPHRTRIILNCTVGPQDAEVLPAVAALARELGVDGLRFTWLSFLGASERSDHDQDSLYHVIPDAELAAFDPAPLLAAAAAVEAEYGHFVEFLPRLSPAERQAWFRPGGGVDRRCLSLWHTLFLRPDGQVVPCGHLQEAPLGSLLDQDLGGLWNGAPLREVRRAQGASPFSICHRCCKV